MLAAFKRNAEKHVSALAPLAATGVPMICLDPAVALTYRDEYVEALGEEKRLPIMMVQEWLSSRLDQLPNGLLKDTDPVSLFAHCTERSLSASANKEWVDIFDRLGVKCIPAAVGCCGMCGVYGHEAEHLENSRDLFESSWAKGLKNAVNSGLAPVVTGYSCRSQIKRCRTESTPSLPKHPLSELAHDLTQSLSQKGLGSPSVFKEV